MWDGYIVVQGRQFISAFESSEGRRGELGSSRDLGTATPQQAQGYLGT